MRIKDRIKRRGPGGYLKDFLGFESFDSGIFFGGKENLVSIFWEWLDLSRAFFSI